MHISDLHRSPSEPIGNSELVAALERDVDRFQREEPPIAPPDAIIVSGDLVRGAPMGATDPDDVLAKQYEDAEDLLGQLATQFLGSDRSRLVIVPGNHDVDWNRSRASMSLATPDPARSLRRDLATPDSGLRWDWDSQSVFQIHDRALYETRLDHYWALFDRFYGSCDGIEVPLDRADPVLYDLNDGRIVVAAFDSCTHNDCFRHVGGVDLEALSRSHLHLNKRSWEAVLRVAQVPAHPRRSLHRPPRTGRRMAPDRRQEGRLAVHATGRTPMSRWKQWVSPPEGALPGGIVTKAGVVLIAVLVGGLLLSWAMTGPQEADTLVALPEAQAVDDGMGRVLQGRIRQEAERQTLEAAARARAELARRQAAAAEEIARLQAESEAPNTAALGIGAAESELREALRLEELERRTRSLRSLPVAHTPRTPDAATRSSEPAGGAADTDVAVLENTVQAALASFEQSVGALEGELAAEQLLLGSPGIAVATTPASGPQASLRAHHVNHVVDGKTVR